MHYVRMLFLGTRRMHFSSMLATTLQNATAYHTYIHKNQAYQKHEGILIPDEVAHNRSLWSRTMNRKDSGAQLKCISTDHDTDTLLYTYV